MAVITAKTIANTMKTAIKEVIILHILLHLPIFRLNQKTSSGVVARFILRTYPLMENYYGALYSK